MIPNQCIKDILSYIETIDNMDKLLKLAIKKGDIDTIINNLGDFAIATNCLQEMLMIVKEERITA
tara:strand:+ start:508 stop:702 length:195 start_codon:yes stop_codon:yes gene_type:complete